MDSRSVSITRPASHLDCVVTNARCGSRGKEFKAALEVRRTQAETGN